MCGVCVAADDLMSLLDAGMHSAAADHSGAGVIIDSDSMFGEEMFSYSSLRARAAAGGSSRQRSSGNSTFADFPHSDQYFGCQYLP